MTDTPRRWDRLTAESDPAFEAFATYLDTGSLLDAYRQRSGKAQATAAPGAWTGMTVYEGKGGIRAVWTRRKEPFGHTSHLSRSRVVTHFQRAWSPSFDG